ncbi:MAG: XRE family transcriptional regulator [Acetobacteraceae bacterium]|nr:XRE family transcriptional regulator [Acetobacteraceae bacterium]
MREKAIADAVSAAAIKHVLAWQIEQEMQAQGSSKAEMARWMGTRPRPSRPAARPRNDKVQLDTVQRAASVLGRGLAWIWCDGHGEVGNPD